MKPRLDIELCTSCHACVSVCPVECISMKEDVLGFLRPQIDETTCIGCGLCERTCNAVKQIPVCSERKIYAAKHKSLDVVKNSSSGGVFTALSDAVLRIGGVIVGARYTDDMNVMHTIAHTPQERDELRGSKYTYSQCDKKLFVQIKTLLEAGTYVLFTGTPCQAAALKVFLRKEYDNLYVVDILCHGITAPVLYRDYIDSLEKKNGAVSSVDFRYSPDGNWHDPKTCVIYKKGKKKTGELENAYFRMFVRNYCLRESCYVCNYASFDRVGDITLGDFWGIESCRPELDAPFGVSVMLVNTQKGNALFELASREMHTELCNEAHCSHDQLNGLKPGMRNAAFVADYQNYGYEYARKKYVTNSYSIRLREKLYRINAIRKLRNILIRK